MNRLGLLAIVIQKELRDGLRDRRSIGTVLVSAMLTPVLLGFMFTVIAGRGRNSDDIKLPVAGVEYAPGFVDWLRQQSGVEVVAPPADPEQAVRNRKEDVVLIVDKEFSKNIARGVPAKIQLVSDSTSETSRPKADRARRLVTAYSGQMAALRLIARGVAPQVALPVRLDEVEVSSAQERLGKILTFLPLLLVIAALTGGLQVAIDATAGERERGSLEPLLLSPAPRFLLAAGKWLAASLFGCASVLISTILTVNVMRRVPWQDLGIRFRLSDGDLFSMLALILPLALFLSAVVLFASTFARSFKEAQGYMGMLILVPMLPGVLSTLYPMSNRPWLAPIPIFGQYALASDVLRGQPPSIGFYLLAGISVTACAVGLVGLTARLLKREAIIFGR